VQTFSWTRLCCQANALPVDFGALSPEGHLDTFFVVPSEIAVEFIDEPILCLTNIVYTVIDSFMSGSNELVTLIQRAAFSGAGYGVSTAMGVTYFGVVSAILVIVIAVASRFVFYQE
jgi:hypothetical protein